MSSHNTIVLSGAPQGRFIEGIVYGTPKPGTAMQLKASTEPVGGKHTWQVYTPGTDGDRRLVAILLESWFLGRTINDTYVSGEQCRLYVPVPGDELQVLLANIAGTADAFAIGDLLIPDSGTGKFLATTGTPEMEPFQVMETLAAITEDTLCHAIYTGY